MTGTPVLGSVSKVVLVLNIGSVSQWWCDLKSIHLILIKYKMRMKISPSQGQYEYIL